MLLLYQTAPTTNQSHCYEGPNWSIAYSRTTQLSGQCLQRLLGSERLTPFRCIFHRLLASTNSCAEHRLAAVNDIQRLPLQPCVRYPLRKSVTGVVKGNDHGKPKATAARRDYGSEPSNRAVRTSTLYKPAFTPIIKILQAGKCQPILLTTPPHPPLSRTRSSVETRLSKTRSSHVKYDHTVESHQQDYRNKTYYLFGQ